MTKKSDDRLTVYCRIDRENYDRGQKYTWIKCYVGKLNYGPTQFEFTRDHDHITFETLLSSDIGKDSQTVGSGELKARDIFSFSVYELDALTKKMRAIDNRMNKLNDKYGHATSFGLQVARFADAVGADSIVTDRTKESASHTGDKYRVDSISLGCHLIDEMIRQWNIANSPAHKPEPTADAIEA